MRLSSRIVFYWTEENLQSLTTAVFSALRDDFLSQNVPNEKRPGLRMCTALAKYISNVRGSPSGSHSSKSNQEEGKDDQNKIHYSETGNKPAQSLYNRDQQSNMEKDGSI